MNFYKAFVKNHYALFAVSASIWLASLLAGIYMVFVANPESVEGTQSYLENIFITKNSFFVIIKNGLFTNISYTIFLCMSSAFLILFPFTFFLIGYKGFSAGYTAAFIIKIYGLKGAWVTAGTIAMPLTLAMPVLFMMFMLSLEIHVYSLKNFSYITLDKRLKVFSAYCLKMFILLCFLLLISVGEAIITPKIFTLLTKR